MRATTQAQRPEETPETRLADDERDRTLRALDALLEDDEAEQQETFAFLKKSLDQDPSLGPQAVLLRCRGASRWLRTSSLICF